MICDKSDFLIKRICEYVIEKKYKKEILCGKDISNRGNRSKFCEYHQHLINNLRKQEIRKHRGLDGRVYFNRKGELTESISARGNKELYDFWKLICTYELQDLRFEYTKVKHSMKGKDSIDKKDQLFIKTQRTKLNLIKDAIEIKRINRNYDLGFYDAPTNNIIGNIEHEGFFSKNTDPGNIQIEYENSYDITNNHFYWNDIENKKLIFTKYNNNNYIENNKKNLFVGGNVDGYICIKGPNYNGGYDITQIGEIENDDFVDLTLDEWLNMINKSDTM
jgi:hypothetical protein